jgi:hypothetical protein
LKALGKGTLIGREMLDELDGVAVHPWRDHGRGWAKVPADAKERQYIGMVKVYPMRKKA